MDEHNHCFGDFFFDFLIGDFRQCLGMGFPAEMFCLEAEEFHCMTRQQFKSFKTFKQFKSLKNRTGSSEFFEKREKKFVNV